jgi:protein-disulfide isomerase
VKDTFVKEGCVSQLVLPVGTLDHVQGPREAVVTLLEYGDFECGHCATAFPVVKEITRWLRGALCYVFRHFPAADKHANALRAAEAAEAAGAQGKFWEMHDLLCEYSPALGEIDLKGYAQDLGLDVERFERERRDHVYLEKVRGDITSGVGSGVTRTPTFFINGVRHMGEVDLDSLLAAIEKAGNRAISGSQDCHSDTPTQRD